ncbi:MAG: DUF1840 family protein [Brachymonas sp.]|nr:DUF1840 family protein [Brachymonas sp.]
MLKRFKSAAAGEIVMLASHAEEIFAVINHPLGERGVIPAAQLPAAIAALQAAIDRSKQQAAASGRTADADDLSAADSPVPFHTRALPFLNMLSKSQAAQADVTWGI